ncbi:MAG: winged helix-turn-helix domain-containing protein [Chloroflexi bacterium]|nr:winged helix-turn-helix domain-containing protein [Chloroflexota bacterium]
MAKGEAFVKEAEALHSLRALEEIEKNPAISQRELSNRLGVALGITNSLVKTLVRKGLIKIRGTSNRSLTYHLTHAGVLAKSKLAMEWTLNTIGFYRQARRGISVRLSELVERGTTSAFFYGLGELTEIALVVAPEVGLHVEGVVAAQDEQGVNVGPILGHEVFSLDRLAGVDAGTVIICKETTVDETREIERRVPPGTLIHRLI